MNKQQLLLQERFSEKIKFSEEYLNKYGRDWYQGLTPSPIAIFSQRMKRILQTLLISPPKIN